jgi:hypothetical protein
VAADTRSREALENPDFVGSVRDFIDGLTLAAVDREAADRG